MPLLAHFGTVREQGKQSEMLEMLAGGRANEPSGQNAVRSRAKHKLATTKIEASTSGASATRVSMCTGRIGALNGRIIRPRESHRQLSGETVRTVVVMLRSGRLAGSCLRLWQPSTTKDRRPNRNRIINLYRNTRTMLATEPTLNAPRDNR